MHTATSHNQPLFQPATPRKKVPKFGKGEVKHITHTRRDTAEKTEELIREKYAQQNHKNAMYLMQQKNTQAAFKILRINASELHSVESLLFYVKYAPRNESMPFFHTTIGTIAKANNKVANILKQSGTNNGNLRSDLKYIYIVNNIIEKIQKKFPKTKINPKDIVDSLGFGKLIFNAGERGYVESEGLYYPNKQENGKDIFLHTYLHLAFVLEIPEIEDFAKRTLSHEIIHKITRESAIKLPRFLNEGITEHLNIHIMGTNDGVYYMEREILERLAILSKCNYDYIYSLFLDNKVDAILSILNCHINELIYIFSQQDGYGIIVNEMIQYRNFLPLLAQYQFSNK